MTSRPHTRWPPTGGWTKEDFSAQDGVTKTRAYEIKDFVLSEIGNDWGRYVIGKDPTERCHRSAGPVGSPQRP